MAVIPYMPLYIADYLADAGHLSTLEHGAYVLLIMNYWQRGGPISASPVRLASVARMANEEWDKISQTISEFFSERDGLWVHKRIELELEKFRDKSAKSKAAGLTSAQRRSGFSKCEPTHDFNVRSTSVEHPFNVRSTSVQRPFNHTDTDTDTDTEKKESLCASVDAPATKVTALGSRFKIKDLPVEWMVWSREEMGWTEDKCKRTFYVFADYWNAATGQKARKADWLATWRNWCRNERERAAPIGRATRESPTDAVIRVARERIESGRSVF